MSDVRFINPPTMFDPPGYTHLVEISGGRIVYISGQVALDADGNMVGEGDFRAQTQMAFENLKAAVEAVSGSMENIVKLTNFVTDMTHINDYREVRDSFINVERPPASTLVQVVRLFQERFMIEIEAVAVIPSE